MTKTKSKNSKTKETTPPNAIRAASPGERYERRESGFYLVKTTASGIQVEHPISNFTAEITGEVQREYEYPEGKLNLCVDRLMVRSDFEDQTRVFSLDADRFNDDWITEALRVHPRAMIYPGKEKHFEASVKTLSQPRVTIQRWADRKTNNKTRKGNREA